jgi:Bardet-Biedl syndrome 4 protein
LGKHKAAIEVYNEAGRLSSDDWEVFHCKGLCYMYLKQYTESEDAFQHANSIARHDATYLALGKVATLQEDYRKAIEVRLSRLY